MILVIGASLEIHAAGVPVAHLGLALRTIAKPDAELGVAEPVGRLILVKRRPGRLKYAGRNGFLVRRNNDARRGGFRNGAGHRQFARFKYSLTSPLRWRRCWRWPIISGGSGIPTPSSCSAAWTASSGRKCITIPSSCWASSTRRVLAQMARTTAISPISSASTRLQGAPGRKGLVCPPAWR
jgi:hypothetical protein